MDTQFSSMIKQHAFPMNPTVMRGIATETMPLAEAYLDRVFRSASKSFPEELKYVELKRCTPLEEYREVTRDKNNRRTFNIAHSDVYMVKFVFMYKEEIINRYVFLPYIREAGIMYLSGTMYHVVPVISDKVISPGFNDVFVRLLRDKITFRRQAHFIMINGTRQTSQVVWSNIYNGKTAKDRKVPATTDALTCIAHYLFAKYGFAETFQMFLGFIPMIGEEDINSTNYPPDQWDIISSTNYPPHGYKGMDYTPTKIRIAIPKDRWNSLTKALVYGFYYITDHFPHQIKVDAVNNTSIWMIALGSIIWSGSFGYNKLYLDTAEHFRTLDDYVDPIITDKLRESNFIVNDFYSLLGLILEQFDSLVLDRSYSALSMFGKSLETLYYILYDITSGFFRANFRLMKISSEKPLTRRHVDDTFNKNFKPGAIFKLTNGKIAIDTVSTSVDHMYPKITALAAQQEASSNGQRGKKARLTVGEGQHADASMMQGGSILFLAKSDPYPGRHINTYACIDKETSTIIANPELEAITNEVDMKLKGKYENRS